MNPDPIRNASRTARRERAGKQLPMICLHCKETDPRKLQLDHTVSVANAPDVIGYLCLNDHAVKHEKQRVLGVELRHDPPPNLLQRALAWRPASDCT